MASYISSIASNPNISEISHNYGGKHYFFKVDYRSKPIKLFMDKYFVGAVSGVSYKLSDGDRDKIAPELVSRLQEEGYSVEVVT